MKTQPKRILQVSICALLAVAIFSIVYRMTSTSPENQAAIQTESAKKVTPAQPLPQAEAPKKAAAQGLQPKPPAPNALAQKAAPDDPNWQTEVEAALNDPDVSVRMRAVRLLWKKMTPESVELLAMFLDDQETVVTEEAIDALGHIANNSELGDEVFNILTAKAVDKEFRSRGPALLTATMVGDPDKVLPLIGTIIAEQDESARNYAVRALSFVDGPDTVPYLTRILKESSSVQTQRTAYSLLVKAGTEEARQVLASDVYAQEHEKQVNSVWALSRRSTEANTQLLSSAVSSKALGDESLAIIARSRAAPAVFNEAFQSQNLTNTDKRNLLRVISNNSALTSRDIRNQTAEIIKPLMNSSDEQLQKDAIETLGKIGADESQAEALAEKLESDSPILQGAALAAYAQYATPKTYKPLKNLWYDEDEKIRRTAFFLSSPFLNQSDMGDLEKATEHQDEFISKQSKLIIKNLNVQEKILSEQ
ncbi:MAG: HEAT repeat domain-containing protein [Deltaproteobacteria bacterium]|nr:HEAT repeat domain-containing protein [Deltaproteobacteria bacterium]